MGLLMLITLINFFDRAAIAFAVPSLRSEFHLDPSTTGWVLGAFGIGYLISNPICGQLIDRFGVRWVLTITIVLWAVFMGQMAAASTVAGLVTARLFLGMGEGGSFPSISGVARGWLPPGERAIAIGIAMAAVPLSSAIGGPLIAALIGAFGWRAAYWTLAAFTLVWAAFWFVFYRDDPARSRHVNAAELALIRAAREAPAPTGTDAKAALRMVLSNRTILANNASAMVAAFFLFFFITWLPAYLKAAHGMSLQQVGNFSALAFGIATVTCVLAGVVSDRILARTGRLRAARSLPIAAALAPAGLALVPIGLGVPLWLALVCLTICLALILTVFPTQIAINVDVLPAAAALSHGFYAACVAISGILAPVIAGYIAEITGSFAGTFFLMAALGVFGTVVVLAFHRPDEDRRDGLTP